MRATIDPQPRARQGRRQGLALQQVVAALAALAAPATLGGCYDPSLRNCTVTCEGPGDCARGQVCGSDGLCAAPDVAGHCVLADAAVAIDAPPVVTVKLHLHIEGKGIVTVGSSACSDAGPTHGDCVIDVPRNVPATLVAMSDGDPFQMWTSLVCAAQGPTCTFTPILPTTDVSARFKKP
jgi:hypothetical protein